MIFAWQTGLLGYPNSKKLEKFSDDGKIADDDNDLDDSSSSNDTVIYRMGEWAVLFAMRFREN